MSVVTIKEAERITGKDRSYWTSGNGRKWTEKDEDGTLWVCIAKFNNHIESLWQSSQVSDKPAQAVSKSASPILGSGSTRNLKSSPTLKGYG